MSIQQALIWLHHCTVTDQANSHPALFLHHHLNNSPLYQHWHHHPHPIQQYLLSQAYPHTLLSTPPSPPISTPTLALALATPPMLIMISTHIPMFHRDRPADKNPYNFLKSTQNLFGNQPGTMDEDKCESIYNHCKSDLDAEDWYIDLSPGDKLTWAALDMAFHIHWPRQTKIQKTTEQKKGWTFHPSAKWGKDAGEGGDMTVMGIWVYCVGWLSWGCCQQH